MPVRTVSDQPYRLQKFKMRLFGASDIRQPDIQVGSSERNIFDEVMSLFKSILLHGTAKFSRKPKRFARGSPWLNLAA